MDGIIELATSEGIKEVQLKQDQHNTESEDYEQSDH